MKDRCEVYGCRKGVIYELAGHSYCLFHGLEKIYHAPPSKIESFTNF